jgi:hypothetical protein
LSKSSPFLPRLFSSNFKNFFLGSAHSRELREMAELYERVSREFGRHRLADEEAQTQFVIDLALDICDAVGAMSRPLRYAVCDLVQGLLEFEGLDALPAVGSLGTLSVEESIALRARLWRLLRFIEDWDRLSDLWRSKIVAIGRGILEELPRSLSEPEPAASDGPDALRLTVPLIDLCREPVNVIERTTVTMYDDDIVGAHLFETVRERLERNLCAASDIPYAQRQQTSKTVVPPFRFSARSNGELAAVYLGGTPFADFLAAQMPFAMPTEARFEHQWIVAGSGHGKTQALQSLIADDLSRVIDGKASIVVIDSQNKLIPNVANLQLFAPGEPLHNRLCLLDPSDVEFPLSLNLFDINLQRARTPQMREALINSTLEMYSFMFGALLDRPMTSKQKTLFEYATLLMFEIPGATIRTFRDLMRKGGLEPYRRHLPNLQEDVRDFFEHDFENRSNVQGFLNDSAQSVGLFVKLTK